MVRPIVSIHGRIVRLASLLTALSALCVALSSGCNQTLPSGSLLGNPQAPRDDFAEDAAPLPGAADAAEAVREIEEADIIKFDGGFAYALNQYKGLIIIDVSKPDEPAIVGRLEFKGRPVEMYVGEGRAYVITTSDVYYPYPVVYAEDGGAGDAFAQPEYDGSKVAVIDLSDPAAPKSMGDILLVGYATASRRVGDVIYVVGTEYPQYSTRSSLDIVYDPYAFNGFVASINVADPNNITPVDRLSFEGDVFDIHVSTTALFAMSYGYDDQSGQSTTDVQYVDISDPTGAIKLRGTAGVPGTVRNRFYMDDYQDVLRVATESFGFGFQSVRVYTYDLKDPDAIVGLGSTEVIRGETLEAVRFDGPRGYLVTFLQKDPLFVVDLTDPAKPTVTGRLEVPGFSTHIEPLGDRLIAVGIDDTQGRRPAVALYDVSDPKTPTQLSRIVLGPPYSFADSAAVYDEKAFKIVSELGLIAIPFNYTEYVDPFDDSTGGGDGEPGDGGAAVPPSDIVYYNDYRCVNAVQLIDFGGDALTQRGWFEHKGQVERVGVIDTRVFALSQLGFQVVNIDDRDAPKSSASLSFLDASEEQNFDGCGYYYGPPVDFPFFDDSFAFFPFMQFFTALAEDYATDGVVNCGTMGIVPLAGMAAGLGLMQRRRSRRR